MKTLENIKAMSFEEKMQIQKQLFDFISNNDLENVKNLLKDYPIKESFYEAHFTYHHNNEDYELSLFDPAASLLRAAFACEENNNDFSILDYLFDEYGLSLKDPKYNFAFPDMKHIKEANEKYILMKEVEGEPNIYKNALIYAYILNAKNPNSQIIQYLVNRGAKFEVHNEGFSGRTPMHFWVMQNNYELLELAIKGGANVDMQTRLIQESEYNETLLFEAVSEPETYKVTKLLIELGANVNFATPRTPLDNARGSRNKKLLKDAGAMTSEQIRKKYNLPAYDSSHCEINGKTDFDLLGKYRDECSKLLNDAIKKAKENGEKKDVNKVSTQETTIILGKTPKELIDAVQNFKVLKALNLLQNDAIKSIDKDILKICDDAINELIDKVVVDSNKGKNIGDGIYIEFSEFICIDYNDDGYKDYSGCVRKELKKSSLYELKKILEDIIKGKSIESALHSCAFYDKKGKFKPKHPNLCYIPFNLFELKILVEMEFISLGQIDLSYIKDLNQLFASYSMEIIHLHTNRKDFSGIESWDVSQIKYMNGLFKGLKDFNADLSKWKVTNVKDFEEMFCDCESFKSDLSKWKPKKAENINSMFHGAKSFDCDLSEWNLPSELVEQSNNTFSDCSLQNNPPSWYKAVFDMDNPSYELLCKLVKARDYKQAKIILEKILPLQNEQYKHITQLCFYVPKGTISNAMPDEDFFSTLVKNAKSQGFHIPISDKVMHTCLRFDKLEYAKFLRTLGYKVVITEENNFGLFVALKHKLSTENKNILEFILDNLDSKINTTFFENIRLDKTPNRRFCDADDETLDFFFQELIKRYPKEMLDEKLLVMFVHSDLIYLLFKHGLKIDLKNIPYDLNIVGRYYLAPIQKMLAYEAKGRVSRFLQLLRHNLLRADSIIEYHTGVKAPALLIFLDNFKDRLDLDGKEYPIKDILIEFASHNVDIQKLGTFYDKDFYEILKLSEYKQEILKIFKK